MASTTSGTDSDGPVQTLISKKIRNLRKKLTRIAQLEESQSNKALNKEQSDLIKSKPQIVAIIEEYEKLRQPLQVAVQEELSQKDSILDDLVRVLYFGSLFDVKNQNEFTNVMLTRVHERGCCLTYDYVDDDDKELLAEEDLDMISRVGSLMISKDVCSKVSHKMAVDECVKRAKMWVEKSEVPISPDSNITYAGLREKLNKITSLDYFTMTPEMKAPVDVAAAVYNANVTTFTESENGQTQDAVQTDCTTELNNHEEGEQEEFHQTEASYDQSTLTESENQQESVEQAPSENNNSEEKEQKSSVGSPEHNDDNLEQKEEQQQQQQYVPRRGGYQNQRGGGGRGRGGYPNGRGGGRRGRGGNGGPRQNGRGQQHYNDSGYYQRNYYNTRGSGGGGGGGGRGSAMQNGNYHGGAAQVELKAS